MFAVPVGSLRLVEGIKALAGSKPFLCIFGDKCYGPLSVCLLYV